jgi:hypothetical protein
MRSINLSAEPQVAGHRGRFYAGVGSARARLSSWMWAVCLLWCASGDTQCSLQLFPSSTTDCNLKNPPRHHIQPRIWHPVLPLSPQALSMGARWGPTSYLEGTIQPIIKTQQALATTHLLDATDPLSLHHHVYACRSCRGPTIPIIQDKGF